MPGNDYFPTTFFFFFLSELFISSAYYDILYHLSVWLDHLHITPTSSFPKKIKVALFDLNSISTILWYWEGVTVLRYIITVIDITTTTSSVLGPILKHIRRSRVSHLHEASCINGHILANEMWMEEARNVMGKCLDASIQRKQPLTLTQPFTLQWAINLGFVNHWDL